MSFNGSGTFSIVNTFVYDTVISETEMNANFSDVATGLSTAITKDGQTTVTANIPMANYKFTGLGAGSAATDSANLGQVQAQAWKWGGTAAGTADALTLTPTPAITAYAAGQSFRFIAGASPNTGAATIAISGLTTKAIQNNGAALAANDIEAGKFYEVTYDGTQFQLNRVAAPSAFAMTLLDDAAATNARTTLGLGTAAVLDSGVASGNLPTVNQAETSTASATTVTLGTTLKHLITGTTTITGFAGVAGVTYHCTAGGAFTLTHDATNLDVLQTGANITTVADDTFDVYMRTTTTAEIRNYQRASGEALVGATGAGTVKAWINFNGTGTIAIRASSNVASITDEGTGTYTITFTTAMDDDDYTVLITCGERTSTGQRLGAVSNADTYKLTTSVRIITFTAGGALTDTDEINVVIIKG